MSREQIFSCEKNSAKRDWQNSSLAQIHNRLEANQIIKVEKLRWSTDILIFFWMQCQGKLLTWTWCVRKFAGTPSEAPTRIIVSRDVVNLIKIFNK